MNRERLQKMLDDLRNKDTEYLNNAYASGATIIEILEAILEEKQTYEKP